MGKLKIKKNDVWIDMTPMSDVMVLLLTFFMLSANFVKNEVVKVQTPASQTMAKVPDKATLDIMIYPDTVNGEPIGRVYLGTDKVVTMQYALDTLVDKIYASNNFAPNSRLKYDDIKDAKAKLTDKKENEELRKTFLAETQIGMPFKEMAKYLGQTHEEMVKQLKANGVPLDSNIVFVNDKKQEGKEVYSEFQLWVKALKQGYKRWYKEMEKKQEKGEALDIDLANTPNKLEICIKADKDTPYATFKKVISELQDINESRYKLLTQYKKEVD